ncbi:MAG: hypothetical protein QOE65_1316 [Solirubrobacteraceae bacterium]|nr:hypothetical protein [Solirubrobacteraceae bacterium]
MRRFEITVTERPQGTDDRAFQTDLGPARPPSERAFQTDGVAGRAFQTDNQFDRGRHADGAIAPLAG